MCRACVCVCECVYGVYVPLCVHIYMHILIMCMCTHTHIHVYNYYELVHVGTSKCTYMYIIYVRILNVCAYNSCDVLMTSV